MKKHLIIIAKIFSFFVFWILGLIVYEIPSIGDPVFTKNNEAIRRFWWELLPLISVLFVTMFFVKIIEKNKIKICLLNNIVKNVLFGIIVGVIWFSIPIIILCIMGNLQFGIINNIPYLFVWIISVLLNVFMQNILVRGYIFELLRKDYNLLTSIMVTTLIFTLFHGGAFEAGLIAVLNVFTMSIFMSLILIYSKSLLVPIIVHGFWNIVGSLLGCVSLADDYPILINTTIAGNKIISGGIYKLEGSIFVLIMNLLFIIVLIILLNRKKSNCT